MSNTKQAIETYSLTLVLSHGVQMPIGPDSFPAFHVFQNWAEARGAIAAAVGRFGIDKVHAVAVVTTRIHGDKMTAFQATHYSQAEVAQLAQLS